MISRDQVRDLVEHKRFQLLIIAVIVFNAVTLGLETNPKLADNPFLHCADRAALAIFVVELS